MNDTTFANTPTIINKLAEAGKTWGLYWQNGWPASGAPMFDPFTPWLFPQIHSAPNGGVFPYDDPTNHHSFIELLEKGQLPDFCYLEPKWGGGPSIPISVNGNDYHPVSDVRQAEYDLCQLFNKIIASPQWPNMLLIITFDEHGGTYDHQPPPPSIAPDSHIGRSGFKYNRLGVRVPTILASPYIQAGTKFGTSTNQVFDHTSYIATLLKWAGIDPANSGLGNRVTHAETFESVLHTDQVHPTPSPLSVDPHWNLGTDNVLTAIENIFTILGLETPKGPMNLAEFRELLSKIDLAL